MANCVLLEHAGVGQCMGVADHINTGIIQWARIFTAPRVIAQHYAAADHVEIRTGDTTREIGVQGIAIRVPDIRVLGNLTQRDAGSSMINATGKPARHTDHRQAPHYYSGLRHLTHGARLANRCFDKAVRQPRQGKCD
ncbi:hypothetical protein D3C80_1324670 [compost metagenome]